MAEFIPNGIFPQFSPDHGFTVGWAGNPRMHREGYKGEELIRRACSELGVEFRVATEIPFERMPNFYRSLDCYVCASEAEGFSTDAMECLAMNVPVITTRVGIPGELNLIFVERSVEDIKRGIEKLFTERQVAEYRWDAVCQRYEHLYARILGHRANE
jgi:glycosyltransferase involved in cell wall biosynthesis